MSKLLVALGIAAVLALAGARFPSGVRAATECGPFAFVTTPVSGGLVVHNGDFCVVLGTSVTGGIHMDGGTLIVCNATVTGGINVAVTGANSPNSAVVLGASEESGGFCGRNTISGGVSISGVTGNFPPASDSAESVELEGNQITGGVTLTNNRVVELESNQISGGCSASGNTSITNDFQQNTYVSGGHATCP